MLDAADLVARATGAKQMQFVIVHVGSRDSQLDLDPPERQGWNWEVRVRKGEVVREVLAEAGKQQADLIVLTTLGRHGFLDALRGSTTERLLARAACPVLAVPMR